MNTVVRKKAISFLLAISLVTGTFSGMFSVSASADALSPSDEIRDSDSGAQRNPIIQNIYTADPAPYSYNGTMYLYADHDDDDGTASGNYRMNDWKCYSSTDMVNWTDHGTVLSLKDFTWASEDAWAGQVWERNGKFYYYVPMKQRKNGSYAIGVGVSDKATGPFKDALNGQPLVTTNSGHDIDPTIFVDDDGQAYLYWGNGSLYYAKLKSDMTSIDTSVKTNCGVEGVVKVDTSFCNTKSNCMYIEGPWFYKRGSLYYMVWSGGYPENICYATSTGPTGPWTCQGYIMKAQGGSFTNHSGLADLNGKSYFFYHNQALPGGSSYDRSICVEQFAYNPDGTIPNLNMTKTGVDPVASLNPYVQNEAETYAWESSLDPEVAKKPGYGIETAQVAGCSNGMEVTGINNGDYIRVDHVDFKDSGAATFSARVACGDTTPGLSTGGTIELHVGGVDGATVGTLPVNYTGGWDKFETKTINITNPNLKGIHNLYLEFKGNTTGNLFNMDNWQFSAKSTKTLVALNSSIDHYKIDPAGSLKTAQLSVAAIYSDGSKEDVTAAAAKTPADGSIVSVSGDGTVTAKKYGSTAINVSYGGKNDIADVFVKDMATEKTADHLTLSSNAVSMMVGATSNIAVTAIYKDSHSEDVTSTASYTVEDPSIADVSSGKITSKAKGTTNVTVAYEDGTGNTVSATFTLTTLYRDPFAVNNAAQYDNQSGTQNEICGDPDTTGGGFDVAYVDDGDWLEFCGVNFGTGATGFHARIASPRAAKIELRIDSRTGPVIGTLDVPSTGGWSTWASASCSVSNASGIHNLYMNFVGGGNNLHWWQFDPAPVSISVTPPTKTSYTIGDKLDTTGLAVTAKYSDGSSKPVSTGYTLSGFDSSTAGTKTVTVTYGGRTATFVVTVKNAASDTTGGSSDHHHSGGSTPATPAANPTKATISGSTITTTSGATFVTDTTTDVRVAGNYTAKLTSSNGQPPKVVIGTPGVFDVQISTMNGKDYFVKLIPISQTAGVQAGVYIDGVKVFVATVGTPAAPSVKSDTTRPVSVKSGASYVIKLTAGSRPTLVAGSAGAFKVEFVKVSGNEYFFRIVPTGKKGTSTGLYVNSGKAPISVATVA